MLDKEKYKIHTILINKKLGLNNANKWILENNFKIPLKGVRVTKNYFRYRQISPETLIKHGYIVPITKKLNDDIMIVIYYKK